MSRRFYNALLLLALLGSNINAVEPTAVLATIKPDSLGKKYCQSGLTVAIEIPMPKNQTGEFKFKHMSVDEKAPPQKTVCALTLSDGDNAAHTYTQSTNQIAGDKLLTKNACAGQGTSEQRELCIYKENKLFAYARYNFDTRTAEINDIIDIRAVNGEVSFTIVTSGGAGGGSFEICHGDKTLGDIDQNADCSSPFTKTDSSTNHVKISDLDPNLTYAFKVRMLDGDTPQSWTSSFERSPSLVHLPRNSYNGAGGELGFSCQSSGGGSPLVLLITLLLLFMWRFKHKSSFAVLGLMLLVLPKNSHADLGQMNFGLLGAMYRPDLDREKLSSGENIFPFYRCHFRKKVGDTEGPINPLMGFEADWHLWDGFGSVQLGFGTSYTYVKGHGLKLKDGQPDCDSFYEEAKTSLHMYQLRPQLTYIFDPFVEYVPLAPYLRAAVIAHGYSFTTDGKDAVGSSLKPHGFRFGYQFALGMMFMLDFLEPSSVTNARSAELFEHVYLKAELAYTKIDTFNRPGLQFSAKDVMGTDWPLLWTFGLVFQLPN